MSRPSTTRTLPLGEALSPTIERLREIATTSYDNLLLANGPPQPDYALLDLCSETLRAIKIANETHGNYHDVAAELGRPRAPSRTERQQILEDWREADREATRLLRRVSKIRATTAPGLYAKALVCRSSASGSAVLAHSLADDFIECEGLRASLWPATGED